MKKTIRLGKSPITNNIYAGHLNKAQDMWIGEKQDVTEDFHNVMAQLVPLNGGIKIRDESGSEFIFTQFQATEEGLKKAINFYTKRLEEIKITHSTTTQNI